MSKLIATIEIGHPSDVQLLEQYALVLREMRALAGEVPLERLLSACETQMVNQGRDANRAALEQVVQERLDDAEKKGRRGAAPAVRSR